jgi:2-hydroxy-6-oxonona-2,4-dienedioate hydrolase
MNARIGERRAADRDATEGAAMDEERFRSSERAVWASVGVTPSERRVRLVGTGCTVRVQECGSGPAVLFVHGASSGGTSWAELAARLRGFRCVMVDRPGCALSDPLPTPLGRIEQIEAYADGLVVDVLDALDIEQAHIVATSYGGYFALRGAAARPERFNRIVELGWTIGAPMSKVPFILRLLAVPGLGRVLSSVMPTNERVVRRMLRQAGLGRALDSGAFSPVALAWFTSVLRDTPTMRNELSGTPRVVLPIRGMNKGVLLPASLRSSIPAAILFLWGDEDRNGDRSVAEAFTAPFPDARVELVARAGHSPWIDHPDHITASISAFLSA